MEAGKQASKPASKQASKQQEYLADVGPNTVLQDIIFQNCSIVCGRDCSKS